MCPLHRIIAYRHHQSAIRIDVVKGACPDKRLDGLAVEFARIDSGYEAVDVVRAALILPRLHDRIYYALSDVLDAEKTESYAAASGRVVLVAFEYRRRIESDLHLAAVPDIVGGVLCIAGHAGHESRHEFHRVMCLEVGCLIRDHRVSRRMRFVERIRSESDHVLEYDLGRLCRYAVCDAACYLDRPVVSPLAVDEVLLFLEHDVHLLFTHGTSDKVGAPERVSAQIPYDLHYLLLIDQAAVSDPEYGLEVRINILNIVRMLFVLNVSRDRVHRARSVQSDARDYVLKARRLEVLHEVGHAAALELEHALGIALGY